MITFITAFVSACLVSALLTPVITALAHRQGWLDVPTESRKVHRRPVPRLGGVAVVVAFMTPLLGLLLVGNHASQLLYQDERLTLGLLLGGIAIVALGVYDDLKGADARLKLGVQSSVAILVWALGFRIELLGNPLGDPFATGILSLPITWLWVVGVINAMNLIDGLDGLASGIALFASGVLFCVALTDNAIVLCLLTASLGGAILGFLFFNFNPARIFLGDSGSMFLGFLLASISIWAQRKGTTAAALLVPVLALGLPILDTSLSFIRRLARGTSPFKADRDHVHHRLMDLGLTHRGTVLTLYATSAVFSMGALALLNDDPLVHVISGTSVGFVVVLLLRRIGVFNSQHQAQELETMRQRVRRASRRIRSADSADEAWNATQDALRSLGVIDAKLSWDEAPLSKEVTTTSLLSGSAAHAGSVEFRDVQIFDESGAYGTLSLGVPSRVSRYRYFEGCLELLSDALAEYGSGERESLDLEPVPGEVVPLRSNAAAGSDLTLFG
ncbi:MAG: MraY family glycosyltransferase [Myxococcota bacterium]